jgi:hypothetical protein
MAWYGRVSVKFVNKVQIWLKLHNNNGRFTWRHPRILKSLAKYLSERKMVWTEVVEKNYFHGGCILWRSGVWLERGFWLVIVCIGRFNTQLVATLYKSLSHKDWRSQSRSSLRCLVAASNIGRSSAPGLTSTQAGGHLTLTSYFSNYRLRILH